MYKPLHKPGSGNQAKKPNQLTSPTAKTLTQYAGAKPKEERFDKDLFTLTKNLINLKLNDPEFDEITLELPRGQIWHQEDNLHLLNLKLTKLVEILQREEGEVKFLEERSEELREELVNKTKYNEESIEAARQQLQDQLERHGQLVQEKEHGRSQNQNVGKELQAKEEAILELNKNIQQLMSDFLAQRDRNDNVEDKLTRIREARKYEEEELKGPRPGSQEYEEKMNRIWALERVLKGEEELRQALDEENEHLKQQLKELAPHSVLSPDDKSPQKAGSLVDLEKYADMKPEDIHRDIETLRNQAYRQQEIINQLEAQNKDDIEAINVQKSRIEDMRAEYVKYMDRFQRAQREKEEALNRRNEVEGESSQVMQKLNNVSILLGKDVTPTGARQSFGEIVVREKPRSPTFNPVQPPEHRPEAFGSRYENREAFVPTPSTLKVLPSNRETKENVRRLI